MRGGAKRLALLLVSVLLSLGAAELLVRALGAAPKVYAIQKGRFQLSHNPKIGYEPVPLVYSGHELSFYDYLGASNSLGYRDREHSVAKPPGTYRIVVLGDSVAAGLHVERNEDIFPPILERLLNQHGLHAEVINLAVSGYNTQQEVETLKEKGLQYHPDLVLLAYTMSSREHLDGDILKTLLDAESRQQDGVSSARVNSWLVHSALYRLIRFRVLGAAGRRSTAGRGAAPAAATATAVAASTSTAVAAAAPTPAATATAQRYLDAVSQDTVAEYFSILHQLADAHHFQVLVAVFPRFVRTFNYYTFGRQHDFAADLARRNHFALDDLLVPFSDCRNASAEPISSDNFHPSPYGHRCAAEALAKAILALPRRSSLP